MDALDPTQLDPEGIPVHIAASGLTGNPDAPSAAYDRETLYVDGRA
jgi:hypothetical protein